MDGTALTPIIAGIIVVLGVPAGLVVTGAVALRGPIPPELEKTSEQSGSSTGTAVRCPG